MTNIFKERFKDKVIIITGAARGIGEATALRAAKEGAKLVLVDIREELGQAVCNRIIKGGGEPIYLNLDISKEECAEIMVEKTIEKYGRLDAAINNAGVMGSPHPLHELPKEAQSMAGQKTHSMFTRELLPEEIAASILYLISDDATHMTGAIMQTDGGWTSF